MARRGDCDESDRRSASRTGWQRGLGETIGRVVGLLKERGFTVQTHASGTNIEGELEDILAAVGLVHDVLHREGSVRLLSYLKLETRSDKVPTLAGKALKD